ncbi:hypothetical protein DPX16_6187 [Anabarilius grahami]|uniref:Uncharacterized protein n=1 Tax=Anabarilius grahami TaxID=495550 RepID=A0A3N0Z2M4_ANAGA|nr:hypothetical protein DPX16_6187 [Anabarilius grahami]
MSAMPSIYSDELTLALAAGKWWAMVEISSPISEEPEYGGHISGQWGDLVEAQDTSCPTSLVFSDASEKAQRRSQHSGFLDATPKTTKQSRQKIAQGGPVPARSKQGAPVPNGSPHGTHVAAPKDNVRLCQAPPQKLCVETDNINENTQQLNCNLESHNHQASRRRPEIRSSLRRGSQLSRKRASDNAGVDPKGVPVHSGTPQGAPVPDGSPHGTPVAAPKVLYVETGNLNEKTQQLNCNPESHNHQNPRRRPEIQSSLRRGSQLSRKRASDNAGLCQAPPQKLCVETDNLNEKTQQLNCNLESHNHQASRRRPEIRSSLRRGSQLSRKRASDNAGVDPKGVPVHSGTPQAAPVPDGSPHGTPVAASKDNVGLCQAPPQKLCVETDNINEKTQRLNCNLESHNHQNFRRRPEIRSSLRRGSQLSRKRASDNAGVDPKGVPVHSGTPLGAPVPDGSPHGTPVAASKDNVGLCQAPPQKLCVETDNINEKTQRLNCNPESHNHQNSRRRPEIRSSLRRGSQLSRKRASDNAGVDPKGVPVHSGTPQGAPAPDGSPYGTPVAAPKVLYVETDNLNEKMQQLNCNPESHNHQNPRRRPEIRSSLRRGSQLSRKKASDNAGVDPKGVPVHSGTPLGAPVPDGSPHGTPVAAPKDNVGLCQAPPQKMCVETDNINEKTQQLNCNPESHNHQASRRRPEIRSSLRRGSQLSRKRASDNAGVDPKGVPVHLGTPQGAPVPDGYPHGTPVAAPKVLYVETDNLNEKTQQLNCNLEIHNHQAPQRRPKIQSSLRRGSQLSRKRASRLLYYITSKRGKSRVEERQEAEIKENRDQRN